MLNLFSVGVKQTGAYVHITGVSFWSLAKDIEKFYSTSLITKYQIRRETWDTIKVHNFYLVELHFILGKLLELRNLRSRRRELSELKHLLETETWLKDTIHPAGKRFDFKRMNIFNTTLLPAQKEFLENYPVIRDSYHLKGILLDSVPGSGKAMPLNTLVKVPNGWRRLGDLQVGDRVIGPKGNIERVLDIHPQGVTDCYEFTFEDGRKAISHPLHLWQVSETAKGEPVSTTSFVTTTQDIVRNMGQFDYRIPLVGRIDGKFTETDREPQAIAEELLLSSSIVDAKVLELSYQSRFAVAQEMVKQETVYIKNGRVSLLFPTTHPALNFQQLIWSLGGTAAFSKYGELYRVVFKHPDIERLVEDLYDAGYEIRKTPSLQLKIVSVKQIEPMETLCISITGEDSLYIVDNWVVTHNTFTSIAWSHLLGDAETVVVCPLNIVSSVWEEQLRSHYKNPPRVWTTKSGKALTKGYDYYIVHYDFLQGDQYEWLKRSLLGFIKGADKLKLILDESHNFNEIKAKQTRRLIELCDLGLFSDALPMSGTPLKALGSEAYPVTCMIDPYFDRTAREFFLASYGRNRPQMMELLSHRIGRGKFTIPELQGMGDPPPFEIIKVKIPNADRFTLDAIKLEMQTYIAERIRFYNAHMAEFVMFYNDVVQRYEYSVAKHPKELADLQRYKAIVQRFRTQGYSSFTDAEDSKFCKLVEEDIERGLQGRELSDFRNVKSAVKYLGLKLRGEALGNVLGKARMEAIKSLVEYADLPKYIDDVEKKSLVFTTYVEALRVTEDHLKTKGYQPITVYGDNNRERDQSVERFGSDPGINPLIATYDSLKEGYPLIMANQILSLNAPYRDYEIKQVQARIWRRGQDSPCFFRMFDLDTGEKLNITTRSINILEWSKEQVDALLGKMQGHVSLGVVTGEEALDIGEEEPVGRPLQVSNSVLTLF